jgi:protein involved in polysaccharide export with SLBB domain
MTRGHRQTTAWKVVQLLPVIMWLVATLCIAPERGAAQAADSAQEYASGNSVQSTTGPTLQQRPRYRIEPADVLDLGFPLSPEFNQTVTVAPDGYISLRSVGDMAVSGKSIPELRKALKQAYSGILHDPVVSVDLRDFQKPFFIVGGQVGHPGKYELREDITVSEALAIAGGTTPNAKESHVLLFRKLPGGSMTEVRKLNFKKMMKQQGLQEDVRLEPGDMLYVPQNASSKIARFIPTSSVGMYAAPGIP